MEERYFKLLIKLSEKAAKKNEVPVSAIIVKDGRVIAKAYNKRETKKNVIYHAEILAIQKACRKFHKWILDDCELYVTLKPCSMCEGAITQSRIKKVYYLLDKLPEKHEYNKTVMIKQNIQMYEKAYKQILKNFFKNKRDKK